MTTTDHRSELSELLCFDLYAASRAVTALYRPLLAPLGLTYPQYLVLVVLWQRTTASVKQLSEALQLDYGTLTPLLRRLAEHDLVTRERDPEDERSVIVGLTEAGVELRSRAGHVPNAICGALGVTQQQAEDLQIVLRTLTAAASTAAHS